MGHVFRGSGENGYGEMSGVEMGFVEVEGLLFGAAF